MRNEFCTVLDVRYLTKGLVLYRSLAKVCAEFGSMWGAWTRSPSPSCARLELPQLTVVTSGELEQYDPEFAQVQPTRGFAEYCKTAKTVLCSYLLEQKPDLELLTFLDADLMFFNDPAPMLDELGDGSILLMPMNRAPARARRRTRSSASTTRARSRSGPVRRPPKRFGRGGNVASPGHPARAASWTSR